MKIVKDKNPDKIFKQAYQIFKDRVEEILKSKKQVTVGIPGGNSARQLFKLFNEDRDLPWGKIHFFMLDERRVPLDHEDSNYKLALDLFGNLLIKEGIIPKENFHPANKSISEYTKELFEISDELDLLIVGAGPDSHMASLFPGHDSVKSEELGFIEVIDSPKPPLKRISASKNLIKKAESALVFFVGEDKHEALLRFSDDSIHENMCPVKILREINNLFIFTDKLD